MNTFQNNAGQRKAGVLAAAVLIALGASMIAGLHPVRAQDATADATPGVDSTKKISLTFTQAPIQDVLKTLFASEGLNYTIDQDVTGSVSVDINNVSFDTALHSLLRATNPPLDYHIEPGNIYHISVKQEAVVVPVTTTTGSDTGTDTGDQQSSEYNLYKIPVDRYDAYYLATLLGNAGAIVKVGANTVVNGGAAGAGGAGGGALGGGAAGGGISAAPQTGVGGATY